MVRATGLMKTLEEGRLRTLDGVDFEVDAGESGTVVGPSGCGKSTLLHLLAALGRPDAGSIVVAGHDLGAERGLDRFRAGDVGLVFQLDNRIPSLTARENVEVPMIGRVRSRPERRARAAELLRLVDLGGRAEVRTPRLSDGVRQRVAIARVLADRPPARSPTSRPGVGTRPPRTRVLELLEALRCDPGLTLVVVTHEPWWW
jgi:putative ABC transport system ATP-binding protein